MKKIYINENQLTLLTEENSPDMVIYNTEVLEYYNKDAYSFIVNDIKGKIVVTVADDYGFTHHNIKKEIASKMMGFKNYSDFKEYIQDNDDLYEEMYDKLNYYINDVCVTIVYEGRYWADNGIITFWDKTPSRNTLKNILNQINNSLNISINDTIVVIRDSFIPFKDYHYNEDIQNDEFNGIESVSDSELRAIHLMNQQDKRKVLKGFRQNRSEVQGKKLGKMPMAQYHNLIYQEEKDMFNWLGYYNNLEMLNENIKNK